jgi:hypothetical protein
MSKTTITALATGVLAVVATASEENVEIARDLLDMDAALARKATVQVEADQVAQPIANCAAQAFSLCTAPRSIAS